MSQRELILCVDDEPAVLEGLQHHLRRNYEVLTAPTGAAGLELLGKNAPAVILSDMRMPGMDGATFLAKARQIAPEAVRLLLTGQTEITVAAQAVNEGQIFRFLTKPCPPVQLLAAVGAAVAQHRLITSERVLLEQTLRGSVETLTEVLALAHPMSFGRSKRLERLVTDLAVELGWRQGRWQVEVAALLSELGSVTLPAGVAEKNYYGEPLTPAEQAMVAGLPAVCDRLLAHIPRLEGVRAILRGSYQARGNSDDDISRGTELLRLAREFDRLTTNGDSPALAIETLRASPERCDPRVLEALDVVRGENERHDEIRSLPLAALRVGMIVVENLKLATGTLLVASGYEVTASFVERVKNFSPGTVKEPIRVIVRNRS